MLDLDDALKIFEDSPERVFRVERFSRGDFFDVFVFSDASQSHLSSLVERANFVMLSEHFESYGWDYVVHADGFSVRSDAPDEVLIFMAECVLALSGYPLLDDSVYSELQLVEVNEFVDELVDEIAFEFDLEGYDIEVDVREFVFDNYEYDGFFVTVDNREVLFDLIRDKFVV